jgi:hypothetical protein
MDFQRDLFLHYRCNDCGTTCTTLPETWLQCHRCVFVAKASSSGASAQCMYGLCKLRNQHLPSFLCSLSLQLECLHLGPCFLQGQQCPTTSS